MDTVLPGLGAEPVRRRYYAFAQPAVHWRTVWPGECVPVRMDEQLLSRSDVQNMRQLVGWVDSFWRTHRDFVDASFGYGMLRGAAVVSWCFGVFVSDKRVELAVATAPHYRGRGYGTAVAARCVAHCVEHGLVPHWHCWEEHAPSWHIAERIGFVDPTPYSAYAFSTDTAGCRG